MCEIYNKLKNYFAALTYLVMIFGSSWSDYLKKWLLSIAK